MNELRIEATKLRDHGYSYGMITDKLSIPKSTLSNWFRDRSFTPNNDVISRIQHGPIKAGAARHNKRVAEIASINTWAKQYINKLSKRDLQMLGIGLYIGEGSKTIESVRIINSDPRVIKLGLHWLAVCFGVKPKNLVIALHLYSDSQIEEVSKFWLELTKIPKNNLMTPQIDRRIDKSDRKRNSLPHGTAHIRVVARGDKNKGVHLFRKIDGLMSAVYNAVD